MRLLVVAAVLGGFFVAGEGVTPVGARAQAASFDCTRARAPDERMICGIRRLEDRDVEMNVLYGLLRQVVPMGTRGALQDEQTAWLAGRRRCGGDAGCIQRAYDRRIGQLRQMFQDRVVANGPF